MELPKRLNVNRIFQWRSRPPVAVQDWVRTPASPLKGGIFQNGAGAIWSGPSTVYQERGAAHIFYTQ